MSGNKKALIAVNLVGFMWFLMDDISLLVNEGYKVTVSADDGFNESATIDEIKKRGASFVDIRCDSKSPLAEKNFKCYQQYRKLISNEGFDVIICHTPIIGLIVRIAAFGFRKKGLKIIYVSHGLAWTHLSGKKTRMKFRAMEDFGSRMCDAIVTINNDDKIQAESLHCPKVYKIDGVGCDIVKYRDVIVDKSAKRAELGIPQDKILILAVGEISQRKNHRIIVEALGLLSNNDRFVYVICGREHGGDSITASILSLASKNGVDVRMLGFRSDIDELCHIADIGVIPSIREGLGMAGIQQLCAGVPMVGTSVQGIKDYIIDGVTGILVDNPYKADGFADAICRLSDSGVRQSMKAQCIATAENFSIENSIKQRNEIYCEVFGW